MNFHKGFLRVDGHRLHYIRAGEGPAVVLLHASPNSARVMRPLQEIYGCRVTTFAFDLPGYGMSDPVSGQVAETAQVADRIAAGMRELGISRAALYGRHTGAGVAVEISIRHPDLCSFVLTDGFPLFDRRYSDEELADYFQIPSPVRDGLHLMWAWYRCREQYLFWPWNKPSLSTRADRGVPDVDYLHRSTVEFLEAGENLPKIYASAFRYDGRAALSRVATPTCFGNRPGDSQYKTISTYPPELWVREFPRDTISAAVEERALLAAHATDLAPPIRPGELDDRPDYFLTDYIDGKTGQSFVATAGLSRRARPLLVIPTLPGSCLDSVELIRAVGATRPVASFDPRGIGESPLLPGQTITVELWVEQAREVALALGWNGYDILALGSGAILVPGLRSSDRTVSAKVTFVSPPVASLELRAEFARHYAPSIAPTPEGGHLLRLWHHLRDQQLFWPFYRTAHENRRISEPQIEPKLLLARALPLLKQPYSYQLAWNAVWAADLQDDLAQLDLAEHSVLFGDPSDVFFPLIGKAEATLGLKATVCDMKSLIAHLVPG